MRQAWHARWQALQLLARPRAAESLPVQLRRNRIYVLPTGFGWFVALLLLVMLLGALNYNNNPALLLALLLSAIGIASTIVAHLQLSGLRLEAMSAEPVPAGSPIKLRLTLARDDARMRRGLRLEHPGADPVHADLDESRIEVDLFLPTRQRGWLDLRRIRISTTQPLGLVRAWAWVWPETPLLVYPRAEKAGPPLPESDGAAARTRAHPLGEELQQLRSYRPGDAPRAISWKHSARRDSLLVREYERPLGLELTLDWRALAPMPSEQRIVRLARWVNEAERENRRYRLNLPGQLPFGPGNGDAHRHLCLRALAVLPHD